MRTIQFDALHRHDIHPDELYNLEELIEAMEDLGGFRISKVLDGEKDTGLWTFEVRE